MNFNNRNINYDDETLDIIRSMIDISYNKLRTIFFGAVGYSIHHYSENMQFDYPTDA
jgi:hypothetical protein